MAATVVRLCGALAVVAAALVQTDGAAFQSPPGNTVTVPGLGPTGPTDVPPNPTQADAVRFAWQAFVAVNWPSLRLVRGAPDRNKMIGQPGEVVWHTWKAPEEVFYDDGRKPPPWNEYAGVLPPECASAGASRRDYLLRRTSKVPGDIANNALMAAKEVAGGTLTDQHGNLVHFDARMNKTIFETITAREYFNIEGQDRAKAISFPAGVMEVKAAWREIKADEPPQIRLRYFRRDAWVYTPAFGPAPATCVKAQVGLVGLHITQKTPSRPQWMWATFEQVDNVPRFGLAPAASGPIPYSFFNPACPPAQCVPNQSTEKNGVPTGIATQVTRIVNIGAAAQQANPAWQAALAKAVPGSAFQFYQLVDVQWPQRPVNRPAGNPTPGLLANTTMETYIAQSSCLNCHFTARTASGKLSSDYSFMLAEAHESSGTGRKGR
jgi:hypothetical protein